MIEIEHLEDVGTVGESLQVALVNEMLDTCMHDLDWGFEVVL